MTTRMRLHNPYGLKAIFAPVSVDEGIRLARRALMSQKPPKAMSLEDQMFELICHLCHLAEDCDEEGDFVEFDTLMENVMSWYYGRTSEPAKFIPVRIIAEDFEPQPGTSRNRAIVLSYAEEDEELADCLREVWPTAVTCGRSRLDDKISRRVIRAAIEKCDTAVVLASAGSLEDEPILTHLIKAARHFRKPVTIVGRSSHREWLRELRAKGLFKSSEDFDKAVAVFEYRSGPISRLVDSINLTLKIRGVSCRYVDEAK